jgi:hypothetical protein
MAKYPHIEVQLSGEDGNPMIIIGRVRAALRRAKVANSEITEFSKEAISGDYAHVLTTARRWVSVS